METNNEKFVEKWYINKYGEIVIVREKLAEVLDSVEERLPYVVEGGNYELKRKIIADRVIIETPKVISDNCDISEFVKFEGKINDIVTEFNDIFDKKFSPVHKSIFNENIKKLKIKVDTGKLSDGINGKAKHNVIYLNDTPSDNIMRHNLMHELLHESTMLHNSKLYEICGFLQSDQVPFTSLSSYLGNGLNEGATEYINYKYFSRDDDYTYPYEVSLTFGISNIISNHLDNRKDEQLIDAYFSCDLLSVIEKMSQYADQSEVIAIIKGIDSLTENRKISKESHLPEDENLYNELKDKIANIYLTKLNADLANNYITREEYDRNKFLYYDIYKRTGQPFFDKPVIIERDVCLEIVDNLVWCKVPKDLGANIKPDIDKTTKKELNTMFDNSNNNSKKHK